MSQPITNNPALTRAGQHAKALLAKWPEFRFNANQHLALVALLATLVAAAIVLLLWSGGSHYRPLYGSQERFNTADIVNILEQEQIPYHLQEQTGQVMVKEELVASTRMLLAAKGVAAQLPQGLEILQQEATLGTSQFVEQARYRHGLEGELARSIMTLREVAFARVHLAIPERTLFLRGEKELPSASIMLEVNSGAQLNSEQVSAIINLVKASVTNLTPANIAVVDQYGNLLSAELDEQQAGGRYNVRQLDYQKRLESDYVRRINAMLHPLLGQQNFTVQVTAHVNFNAVEETKEAIDPTAQVREEMINRSSNQGKAMVGIPGALSNQPPVIDNNQSQPANGQNAAAEPAMQNEQSSQQSHQRRFDYGRTVTHTKYQQGNIDRVSVAVMLNNAVATDPAKGFDEAQLQRITEMAKDAIGFSAQRGDQFSINAFTFAEGYQLSIEPMSWWQDPMMQVYLRYLVILLLGSLLILFVLRRLVNHLLKRQDIHDTDATLPSLGSAPPTGQQISLPDQDSHPTSQHEPSSLEMQMNTVLPGSDSPLQDKLTHLKLLADQDPRRVAEVIEQWLYGKA